MHRAGLRQGIALSGFRHHQNEGAMELPAFLIAPLSTTSQASRGKFLEESMSLKGLFGSCHFDYTLSHSDYQRLRAKDFTFI